MDKELVIKDVQDAAKEIPFGNSGFQTVVFNINQETPTRTYRQILLELNKRLNDLKGVEFKRKRNQLDLLDLRRRIEDRHLTDLAKDRLRVDIEEKEWNMSQEDKLIDDAIHECNLLYSMLKQMPKITRADFEKEEANYWMMRLQNDALRELKSFGFAQPATLKSLENMGMAVTKGENGTMLFEPMNRQNIEEKKETT